MTTIALASTKVTPKLVHFSLDFNGGYTLILGCWGREQDTGNTTVFSQLRAKEVCSFQNRCSTPLFSRSPLSLSKDENPYVFSPPILNLWGSSKRETILSCLYYQVKASVKQRVWIKSKTLAVCMCGVKLLLSVLLYSPWWCEREGMAIFFSFSHTFFFLFFLCLFFFFSFFFRFSSMPLFSLCARLMRGKWKICIAPLAWNFCGMNVHVTAKSHEWF